jgi:dolichyl-phosphate beta-glucosyltransferase
MAAGPKAMTADRVTWVVPCFEEAKRIHGPALLTLSDETTSLVFVDDGSRDQTPMLLRGIAEKRPLQIKIIALPRNQGKAEAVRQGMLDALSSAADIIGYVDADLATPPSELRRLAALARSGDYDVLMGSRIQLLGHAIERNPMRHYIGRVFATCASLTLGLPVYDTQCGAKLFRRTEALIAALAQPFISRWAFDVELLARLIRPRPGITAIAVERIREEPLLAWSDMPGSKLRPTAALRSGLELIHLGLKLRRR